MASDNARAEAMDVKGKKIAIIGAGVSGLASAWLLDQSGASVTLFEKEESCGGHTLTDRTSKWPIDVGFQVYNLTTYPHFVAWLEHLQVDTEPSEMSFSLSIDAGQLEWASHDLASVFAQRKNMASATFLRMMWDVLRFGRRAPDVLKPEHQERYGLMPLGQYLHVHRCAACSSGAAHVCSVHSCHKTDRLCCALRSAKRTMRCHLLPTEALSCPERLTANRCPCPADTARRSKHTTSCLCVQPSGPCRQRKFSTSQSRCSSAFGSIITSWTSCNGPYGALFATVARATCVVCWRHCRTSAVARQWTR
jgi:NAD(P)-binding Rossmann-like domain